MAAEWDAEEAYRLAFQRNPYLTHDLFTGKLFENEAFWVDLQPFLLMRGYKLRPRYQPDWIPSWFGSKKVIKNIYAFEDAFALAGKLRIIDAIRERDGTKVVIKCIDTSTEEIPILRYLYSPGLISDPRNHTVPLLDTLLLPNNDEHALIVMPQLLQFHRLPFRRIGEIFEAIYQYLQGLEFMHEHRISHRDACYFNLMMDASKVVPRGFHYAQDTTHDGVNRKFHWRERWSVRPIQYYYIDFGISRRYRVDLKDIKDTTRLGQDRSAPEYALPYPYDPLKADVYQLGNVLLKVIAEYNPDGLEPFLALGRAMTRPNPNDRPSPGAALKTLAGFDQRMFRRRIWSPSRTKREKFDIMFCGWTPVV